MYDIECTEYEYDDRRYAELHEAQSCHEYQRAKTYLRHADKSGNLYQEDEENV